MSTTQQARNQVGEKKTFPPLEKCVGHPLKLLYIVKKFGPLSETLRPSWCFKLVTSLLLSNVRRGLRQGENLAERGPLAISGYH